MADEAAAKDAQIFWNTFDNCLTAHQRRAGIETLCLKVPSPKGGPHLSIVDAAYCGREQTLVKHEMLRRYLGPAARIIGSFADSFVYVDCCCGPWNTATEDLSDTSFHIALEQLRAARTFLRERGREVEFRCIFVEKDPEAFLQLERFCRSVSDIKVNLLPRDFTEAVADILAFVREQRNSFPFFFIDPTGWSPLAISAITPLLRSRPSEVLINFMTSHIKRFLESSNFEVKFGPDYMRKVMGLTGQERDDQAAYSFADEIRRFYSYTCTSVVLNPLLNRTHFHLIYGTRHPKGLEKFKEAEKSCFGLMQSVRIDAQSRKDFAESKQDVLFDFSPVQDRYLQQLRRHYLAQAFSALNQRAAQRRIDEQQAWSIVSQFPLVWKSDLRCSLRNRPGIEASTVASSGRG